MSIGHDNLGRTMTGYETGFDNAPEYERAHGEFPMIRLPANKFVKMSQVRGERNRVSVELRETILKTGLLNPIDAGLLTPEALTEYIDFTNQTWGATTTLEDFNDKLLSDGRYCLVIAGHSRHQSIEDLEAEGRLEERPILAKVHEVAGVWDILEIQLAENIHSQPPKERQAIAIVEAYNYGLAQGRWSTPEEFIGSGAGEGATITGLQRALHFARLPGDLRSFVLSGVIPYTAGVELGATVETARRYAAAKSGFFDELDPAIDTQQLEQVVREALVIQINKMTQKKLNSTAAEKMILAWRKQMNESISRMRGDDVPELELELVSAAAQLDALHRQQRHEINMQLSQIARLPASAVETLIRLQSSVLDEDEVAEYLELLENANKATVRRMGRPAVKRAQVEEQDTLI